MAFTGKDLQGFPRVEGVSHKFIDLNGLRYHVAESGQGEPLVLLHGWPQHWYMWHNQIPELSKKYRVICIDIRGFGWTETPRADFTVQRYAQDILALLDQMNLETVYLMGHDWGGWIGFLMSLSCPEKIIKYVALNITHPFQIPDARLLTTWRFWYMFVIASPWLGKFVVGKTGFTKRILKWGVRRHIWTEEELEIYTAQFKTDDKVKTTNSIYRAFLLKELLPALRGRYRKSKLTVPTLILFGKDDFFISPASLKGYEPYAENLRVELVPNCGHFIAEDQPEIVNSKALEFFASSVR